MGATFKVGDIPADLVDSATEWREKLLEQVAEMDDDVMEKYLDVSLIGLHTVVDILIPHVVNFPNFPHWWQHKSVCQLAMPTCNATWQQGLGSY